MKNISQNQNSLNEKKRATKSGRHIHADKKM